MQASTETFRFDPASFLTTAGDGRKVVRLRSKQALFTQGRPADFIFYLQSGRAKLTVLSSSGKEATITLFGAGSFLGEEALAAASGQHRATATALTTCTVTRIARETMMRVIHEEQALSDLFLAFLLGRSMRMQADLVDHLFNNSEKRLARILLLMAEFDQSDEPEVQIPRISQEALAEMVGTTRSRVSFFMNRFRRLGFVQYKGRIFVHKSLLNVLLHD